MASKITFIGCGVAFVGLLLHLLGGPQILVTILCVAASVLCIPFDFVSSLTQDRLTECVGKTEFRHHSSSSLKSFEMEKKFKPRPTDIVISTPPKTGTTLMQQMCHQIRSGGDMSFEDIYYVVPWTCHFYDLNQDPNAEQPGKLRLFKSHQIASALYGDQSRYIFTIRKPEKTFVSFYSFLRTLGVLPEEMDIDSFAQKILVKGTDYPPLLDYFVEYWKCAHLTDMVLILKFEDILEKKQETIKQVAAFMNIECDEKLIKTVEKLTSKEVMNQHSSKFDGSVTNDIIAKNAPDAEHLNTATRATDGSHHKKFKLSSETLKMIEKEWEKKIYSLTGCKTYEDFSAKLIAKNRTT